MKKFSEELFQFTDLKGNSLQSIYSRKKTAKQDVSLQSWFNKLLNHEKAIVLTVIDSELVSLIKQMHESYTERGHGTFQASYPVDPARESSSLVKVGGQYPLLFHSHDYQGPSSNYRTSLLDGGRRYDTYGPAAVESKTLKQQQQAQDSIISYINIVKIGNEEAITLSNYLLENTGFLLQMMQTIDPNFMLSDLKVEKTDYGTAMAASVLQPMQN